MPGSISTVALAITPEHSLRRQPSAGRHAGRQLRLAGFRRHARTDCLLLAGGDRSGGATLLHGPVIATYQAPTVIGLTGMWAGDPPERVKAWLAIPLALALSVVGGLAGRCVGASFEANHP